MVKRSVKKKTPGTNNNYLFTSESVTMGHPDKVADQVSDAVLDALIAKDPFSRVACETLVTTGLVIVAGEITTKAYVDIAGVARKIIPQIGYDDPSIGFDSEDCAVIVSIDKQSPDISQGVTTGQGLHKEQGAGDQGLMFGYACKETPVLMPMPIYLAHKLTDRLAKLRQNGTLKWLRPDGKSQVTIEYNEKGKPIRIHTVVISTQHRADIKYSSLRKQIIDNVIMPVLPKRLVDKDIIKTKLGKSSDDNTGELILLEELITFYSNDEIAKEICTIFKKINDLRKGYPIHGDNIKRVLPAHYFFSLKYPIENYNEAWEIVLSCYFESMRKIRDIFIEYYNTEYNKDGEK